MYVFNFVKLCINNSLFHHGFSNTLSVPQGCRVGDVGYLIPEAAPGDRAIDIVEVQIPTYVPMCPLLGEVGHNIDRRISLYFRWSYHLG